MDRGIIEEALRRDLWELGAEARKIRGELYGGIATFVSSMVLNYTNVCVVECEFCPFWRRRGDRDAYALSPEEAARRVLEVDARYGLRQVLVQGGINPEISIEYFEGLFKAVKAKAPHIAIHALSPLEVDYLARRERMSWREVLERLKEAGMDSMPGGGGEILVDKVRREISPKKIGAEIWLRIMEEAHKLDIPTSATMMYGHVEGEEDWAEHLRKIAELQGRTRGFTAFIAWNYEPQGNKLGERVKHPKTAATLLRIVAAARVVFTGDAFIPHIQSSWLTNGPEAAELAMHFGADDFGGTLYEEKVLEEQRRASPMRTREDVVALIRRAGFTPAERDNWYRVVKIHG